MTDRVAVGRHCGVCGKNWVPKIDLSGDVVGHHGLEAGLMSMIGHAAERAIRPCVIARKISGGTRSAIRSPSPALDIQAYLTRRIEPAIR